MDNSKNNVSDKLLNALRSVIEVAKNSDIKIQNNLGGTLSSSFGFTQESLNQPIGKVKSAIIEKVEGFFYGNVIQNIISNLPKSEQKYSITKKETKKFFEQFNNLIKRSSKHMNSGINTKEYEAFKKYLEDNTLHLFKFIECFEKNVQMKKCQEELDTFKKTILFGIDNSIREKKQGKNEQRKNKHKSAIKETIFCSEDREVEKVAIFCPRCKEFIMNIEILTKEQREETFDVKCKNCGENFPVNIKIVRKNDGNPIGISTRELSCLESEGTRRTAIFCPKCGEFVKNMDIPTKGGARLTFTIVCKKCGENGKVTITTEDTKEKNKRNNLNG